MKLARLYVDRAQIGTGVGAALMGRCLELARAGGHDVVWLTAYDQNAQALGFYERWGFTEVGEMYFTFGSERPRNLVLRYRRVNSRASTAIGRSVGWPK